jgi:hypothetical protein
MASKGGGTTARYARDPRNPYDWPGGRCPNPFDGMSIEDFCAQIDKRFGDFLVASMPAMFQEFHDEIVMKSIDARLTDALFFRGVYVDGTEYQPCSMVQHGGTVWVTKDGTTGRPGEPDSGWRMLVKTVEK